MQRCWIAIVLAVALCDAPAGAAGSDLYVDGRRGNDRAIGSKASPVRTLSAAISRLPSRITEDMTIHLAAGVYGAAGGGRNAGPLELDRQTADGVRVRIVGTAAGLDDPASSKRAVLDWPGGPSGFLIAVRGGHWSLENVQLGTRKRPQRGGIRAVGPGQIELRDVRIRTGSGAGLLARYGGRIDLYGAIELNEDLHEAGGTGENFCRVEAELSGCIRFRQRSGASLSVGNGTLDARWYGVIVLGCEKARITSWTQSNPIAVNHSGRVDLNATPTDLCATSPRNTPIGLEHDGHVMAEGARITIHGRGNNDAIVLQKVSSLFCNDVRIEGDVKCALRTYSGSMLLVGILGDLGPVRATTGSKIVIEKCTGRLLGPVEADKMSAVLLPDGKAVGGARTSGTVGLDPAGLPPLHAAVYAGHQAQATRLIAAGAAVNARGPGGLTPLHIAAMRGHSKLAEFLLAQGAEISARNDDGLTAAELAELHGHSACAQLLRTRARQHAGPTPQPDAADPPDR